MVKKPEVQESHTYQSLAGLMPSAEDGSKPDKPSTKIPDYPFTMKVNTWTLGGTEKFAEAIGMDLCSDVRAFTFVAIPKASKIGT